MNNLWLITLLLFLIISCNVAESEEKFRKTELAGIIANLEYEGRDVYTISVRDFQTKDTLAFHLYISKFIEDNKIAVNDSVKKEVGHEVYFYRRNDIGFSDPIKLYYY